LQFSLGRDEFLKRSRTLWVALVTISVQLLNEQTMPRVISADILARDTRTAVAGKRLVGAGVRAPRAGLPDRQGGRFPLVGDDLEQQHLLFG
jgi:hypothetical protein